MARKKVTNPFVAGIRGLTGGEPRVSDKELREALDVRRKSKKPVAQTGATARSGYDPLSDRAFRALGRVTGSDQLVRNLRDIDENLIGIGAAEQGAFNIGRGEGGIGDALNVALTLPGAGLAAKPFARAGKSLAAKVGDTAAGRYLTEARPLVGAADEAINPATLNIGLEPSSKIGGPVISEQEALSAVRRMGREPQNFRVVPSSSEPTLVADIEPPLSAREVYDLSEQLRQDAIAQRLPSQGTEAGMLAGPRAQDWGGEFNPAYFTMQGGDTLGAGVLTDQFRAGAPVSDILETAGRWGIEVDPVALSVNARLRDAALEGGEALPESLGVFTGRTVPANPEALQAYREAQRQLAERRVAENYLSGGRRTQADIDLFSGVLSQLPEEETLLRTLREGELPMIGMAPERVGAGGRGVHISTQPGLSTLDPSYYGTGHRGEEYASTVREGLPNRTYMYVGPEGTVEPELSVMGVIGEEMRRGPRYAYTAELKDLYDVNADPEQLVRMAQAYNLPFYKPTLPWWAVDSDMVAGSQGIGGGRAIPDMERWIKERGYPGYISDFGGGRAAALYGPTDVVPIDEEPITDWRRKFAVGGRV